jgi:hypothetical protein
MTVQMRKFTNEFARGDLIINLISSLQTGAFILPLSSMLAAISARLSVFFLRVRFSHAIRANML